MHLITKIMSCSFANFAIDSQYYLPLRQSYVHAADYMTKEIDGMKKELAVVLLSVASAMATAGSNETTVTFSNGTQGWTGVGDGIGGSWISSTPGKHGAAYYSFIPMTFGIHWMNKTNRDFVFNYGNARKVSIGIDVKVNSITYLGREVPRELVLELRDYDKPYGGMPYTSVWYNLGTLSAGQRGWKRMSVTIEDTRSKTLPSGWGGYGMTGGAPMLPPGRTFADVLANFDEAVFTTFMPGMFYGYTDYDVAVDNISIETRR